MTQRTFRATEEKPISGLTIVGGLVPAVHAFSWNGYQVEVRFPPQMFHPKTSGQGKPPKGVNRYGEKAWTLGGLQDVGPGNYASTWSIPHYMVVSAAKGISINIPPGEVLEGDPAFGTAAMSTLSQVQSGFAEAIDAAYEYWLKVVRWKLNNPFIGRSQLPYLKPEAALVDASTGELVAMRRTYVTGEVPWALDAAQWEVIRAALVAGELPPLALDYYFAAHVLVRLGDLRRAIIDLAIATEVHMKSEVVAALPKPASPSAVKALERKAMHVYRNQLFPKLLSASDKKTYTGVQSSLKSLSEDRNGLMHNGRLTTTRPTVEAYVKAVGELLQLPVPSV